MVHFLVGTADDEAIAAPAKPGFCYIAKQILLGSLDDGPSIWRLTDTLGWCGRICLLNNQN